MWSFLMEHTIIFDGKNYPIVSGEDFRKTELIPLNLIDIWASEPSAPMVFFGSGVPEAIDWFPGLHAG